MKSQEMGRLFIYPMLIILAAAMLILSGAVQAQKPSGILIRTDDPLSRDRDATRPDRSEDAIRTAVTGTPSEVAAELKYAQESLDAQPPRYAEAEKHYLRAAKLKPNDERAYLGLGNVYARQERVNDATIAFQKAIEIKPKFAQAHFNLGVVFVAIRKKDEAFDQYKALQDLDKKLASRLKEMIDQRFSLH
jgi:tetratricopeptide (TPR) repeat protein